MANTPSYLQADKTDRMIFISVIHTELYSRINKKKKKKTQKIMPKKFEQKGNSKVEINLQIRRTAVQCTLYSVHCTVKDPVIS